MAKRLFVGSLPYTVDDAKLQEIFSKVGSVVSAKVIMDRETGRSKGFGFVEYTSDPEADAAIKEFDGTDLEGRKLVVNEARPQENRGSRPQGGNRGNRW